MKKIVYVSIIAALSIIMFSAVVSAGDYRWGRFHGVYEMTAQEQLSYFNRGIHRNSGWLIFRMKVLTSGEPPTWPMELGYSKRTGPVRQRAGTSHLTCHPAIPSMDRGHVIMIFILNLSTK